MMFNWLRRLKRKIFSPHIMTFRYTISVNTCFIRVPPPSNKYYASFTPEDHIHIFTLVFKKCIKYLCKTQEHIVLGHFIDNISKFSHLDEDFWRPLAEKVYESLSEGLRDYYEYAWQGMLGFPLQYQKHSSFKEIKLALTDIYDAADFRCYFNNDNSGYKIKLYDCRWINMGELNYVYPFIVLCAFYQYTYDMLTGEEDRKLLLSTIKDLVKKNEAYKFDVRVINVNSATREQLMNLPGIEDELADRIIEARSDKMLKDKDDMLAIKGIGTSRLHKILPYINFEEY